MGRIKTTFIKRTTKELIKRYKKDFAPDFDKNKKVVNSKTDVTSKKVRNVIAGYATRLIKADKD